MTVENCFVPLLGGCNCGNVRFRMEVAPIITHCCHCRQCQRFSGSAFRVNSMIETEHLKLLQGAPQAYQPRGGHAQLQCPECRSALWTHHPRLGLGIAFVGSGTLDQGEHLAPEAHYFTRSKHAWVSLPTGLPVFEELGDPGKPGAAARIHAVLARMTAPRFERGAAPERRPT
jgi:hypothetical protein